MTETSLHSALLSSLLSMQKGQIVLTDRNFNILHQSGIELVPARSQENLLETCPFLYGMEAVLGSVAAKQSPTIEMDQLVIEREEGASSSSKPLTIRMRVSAYDDRSGDKLLFSFENSEASFESVQAQVQARNELALVNDLLAEARAEAERANKAKSRFLSTITHELRTPLSIIIGNMEILANDRQISQDEDLSQSVEDANDYAHYMLNLVGDLLDLAKAEAGKLELKKCSLDVSAFVEKLCLDLKDLAVKKGVTLVTQIENTPTAFVDPTKIQQLVSNLVFNAIKFTPKGGKIQVDCKSVDQDDILFRVVDTGQGISEQDLASIGQPFTQFDAEGQFGQGSRGTGLGLALVKSIVSLHEGTFEISSQLGEGTDIKVSLPVSAKA